MTDETTNVELRACWARTLDKLPEFCRKVQPMFALNNWRWAEREGMVIPTAQMLEALAYSLAWEAYKYAEKHNQGTGVSSGRLVARFHQYNNGEWAGMIAVEPERISG